MRDWCASASQAGAAKRLRLGIRSAILILLLMCAPAAWAQAFRFQAGSSSIFDGHGGSVEIRGLDYTMRLGVGLLDKPRLGFLFIKPMHGMLWTAGDQAVPFDLPTDFYSSTHYFLARGIGARWQRGGRTLFLFGGAASRNFMLPFLSAAGSRGSTGMIFYEQKISPSWRFTSHNAFGSRQTSIQSLEWRKEKLMRLSLSGGVGNNEHFSAVALEWSRSWFELQAGYTSAGADFRRVRAESPTLSEIDRENLRLTIRPVERFSFTLSRHHYLTPREDSAGEIRATVNGASASGRLAGFLLHGSLYDSQNATGRARAVSAGGRRSLGFLDASVDYLRSLPTEGRGSSTIVTTLRERVTQRLTLSQIVTRGNGQTSVTFGGSFFSNRFSLGVEYQTIYVPFVPLADSPFRQVLMLSLRMQLPFGMELSANTDTTPLGKTRYTAYTTGYAYRGMAFSAAGPNLSGTIQPYVLRGQVVDENGQPVRGAALRIGGNLVFTDSQGRFTSRHKRSEPVDFSVALDEFTLPGNYSVAEAPSNPRPEKEASAQWLRVVLRRLRSKPRSIASAAPSVAGAQPEGVAAAAGAFGLPLPLAAPRQPVLELSPIPSIGSGRFTLPITPPMKYKGAASRAAPPGGHAESSGDTTGESGAASGAAASTAHVDCSRFADPRSVRTFPGTIAEWWRQRQACRAHSGNSGAQGQPAPASTGTGAGVSGTQSSGEPAGARKRVAIRDRTGSSMPGNPRVHPSGWDGHVCAEHPAPAGGSSSKPSPR